MAWRHSPLQTGPDGIHGIVNAPALVILLIMTLLLIKGISESATVNAVIVGIKVTIVLMIIAIGWHFINPANHTPFVLAQDAPHRARFKHGWGGVLGGAGVVFFAFIGFDAVSTAAQETINPGKNMPIGILGSLGVCTFLYILFSWVLTGIAPALDFIDPNKGMEASVSYAIHTYMPGYGWLSTLVSVAILAGFSSVMLVMLLGQSRVFFSMSKDGLLPKLFAEVHPKFRTPYKCNMVLYVFVGIAGRVSAGRHHRQHDEPGHAVCVCAGVHRGLGHAEEESAAAEAVPSARGAVGVDYGIAVLPGDDHLGGCHVKDRGRKLDADWAGGLLPVREESQQSEQDGSWSAGVEGGGLGFLYSALD